MDLKSYDTSAAVVAALIADVCLLLVFYLFAVCRHNSLPCIFVAVSLCRHQAPGSESFMLHLIGLVWFGRSSVVLVVVSYQQNTCASNVYVVVLCVRVYEFVFTVFGRGLGKS